MNWDTKRRLIYALAFTITLASLLVFLLRDVLFPKPTCVDKKQNGFETGVDCGGGCALTCKEDISELVVIWSKAIKSSEGVYDLVAMINNNNIDNATPLIGYTFNLYDDDGKVFGMISGSTTAPLSGKFPIIVQNVPLDKIPKNITTTITDGTHYKVKEKPTSQTVKIMDRRYETMGDKSRVYASVINTKRVEIRSLPVRMVLFDQDDNAYAVGQTVIPILPKEGVREVVFTWQDKLSFAPTRIEMYPIFDPFQAIDY